MTDKEVMQMALDALEDVDGIDTETECVTIDVADVIEALRAALAQPESEPVAWRFDHAKYRENDLRGRQWAFNVFSQTKPYMDEMVRDVTPLYTTPPQREWQGLTDEEIMSLLPGAVRLPPGWADTVRAIEAKLKEKNT